MSERGRYILIEGDEGAGKTTQVPLLQRALQGQGLQVEIVREPGGDAFGEALRQILKHADYDIPPIAEMLAFCAGRASMLTGVVKPLLDRGTWVISDRGYISTLATQGAAHGLDSADFRRVVDYAIQSAPPDLAIVLDITLEEAKKRQHGRGLPPDRFDRGLQFRTKVNDAYRHIEHPNLVHIDAFGDIGAITHRLLDSIREHVGQPIERRP